MLRRQRVLAVCAAVCLLPGLGFAAWVDDGPLLGVYLLLSLPVAAPLWRGPDQRSFVRRCVVVSVYLTAVCVLGVFLGLNWFLPVAVLLALAAATGPRRGLVTANASIFVATFVVTGFLAGSAWAAWNSIVGPALAEPHTFRAELNAVHGSGEELGPPTGHLERLGATDVSLDSGSSGWTLEVRFPDELPEDRRARLRAAIVSLEDVSDDVELCPVHECG